MPAKYLFSLLNASYVQLNKSRSEMLGQYYIRIVEESTDGNSLCAGIKKLFKTVATPNNAQCLQLILQLNPRQGTSNPTPACGLPPS